MKYSIYLFFIIIFFQPSSASAQITFQKTFGDTLFDALSAIQQTADGGYVTVGSTNSFGAGGSDVYLIKLDSLGDTLWTKTYGTTAEDYGSSVRQTVDGGYIITGSTNVGFDYNAYLIKTDPMGNVLWSKTYGAGPFGLIGYGNSVRQTTDGGFIVLGTTVFDLFAPENDFYLIRTDSVGDTLWTKAYGGTGEEFGQEVQLTSDGGYILTGESGVAGFYDIYVIKIDANGDTLWTNSYGGGSDEESRSVQQTADGGYIIIGQTQSFGAGGRDFYLLKLDSVGDTLWTKTYGGSGDDRVSSGQQTADGGYIILGRTQSFGAGDYDAYLIKTDSVGDTLWTRVFGGDTADAGASVLQTVDGGFIIAGSMQISGGSIDGYLIKLDANGNSGCNQFSTNTIVGSTATVVGPILYSPATVKSGSVVNTPVTSATSTSTADSMLCALPCNVISSFIASANSPCVGATVIFTNTSVGAISYEWQEDGTPFSTAADTARTFSTSGTFTISLRADSGICSDFSNVVITINPTYDTTIAVGICQGDSIQLPSGVYTDSSGTYVDTLTSVNGCDSAITITLTVNPTYSMSASMSICSGDSAFLEGFYQTSSGIYYDTLPSVDGCDSVISTLLAVNPLPIITIMGNPVILCADICEESLTATVTDGTSPYTYQWDDPSNQTTATASGLCFGNYILDVTDSNGCTAVAASTISGFSPPLLTMNSTPDTANTGVGMAWVVATGGQPPYTFQWDDQGSQSNDTAFGLSTGNYTVVVTDANGCSDSSNITVSNFTGVNQSTSSNYQSIMVYPNPTTGSFSISMTTTEVKNLEIKVFNGLGQIIYLEQLEQFKGPLIMQLDLREHSTGVYNVQIVSELGVINRNVIIEK